MLASDIVYNLRRAGHHRGAGDPGCRRCRQRRAICRAQATAQGLIDAIFAQSGRHYAYIEIAPTTANSTGGEPAATSATAISTISTASAYVEGSAELITGAAYNGCRKPLVAHVGFPRQKLTTINVHFTSRGGSDPLVGQRRSRRDAGDAARTAQAAGVKAYVNDHLADQSDPPLRDPGRLERLRLRKCPDPADRSRQGWRVHRS